MLKNKIIFAIIVILIAATGSLQAEEGLKPLQKAPAFILKILEGDKAVRSKSIFSERELTVLIFWDSYCPDCLKAVAECQKYYQDYRDPNVGLWSVNFDKENMAKVRSFIAGEGIKFPVLSDSTGATANKYEAAAYDFSFFIIDRDGVVRYVCYDHPPDVADVIKTEVGKLLKKRLKVSDPAPDFSLKTLDESKTVGSKEIFPQKELTILMFWNSQSKGCLDSVVECEKLYKRSDELGFTFFSINFDKTTTNALDFVKKKGTTYPVLSDISGIVPKSYNVEDYCFSVFIVDKKGIIRYILYGFLSNLAETIEAELKTIKSDKE